MTVNEMFNMVAKMANGEISTGHEVIASKKFSTADGKYTATAEISVQHDIESTEIVNGGVSVTTGGGIVYSAANYAEAIKMAKELVAHWDNGDYAWEPCRANYY